MIESIPKPTPAPEVHAPVKPFQVMLFIKLTKAKIKKNSQIVFEQPQKFKVKTTQFIINRPLKITTF